MNMSKNIVRYMSESSFVANGSLEWITKNATSMVKIIGIRQRRNSAPSMNPKVHTTSAKSTSQNDMVSPIFKGSGNACVMSLNVVHFAMPWLRNMKPKIMRTRNNNSERADDDDGSLNRKFFTFFVNIICDVFCETPHIVIMFSRIGLISIQKVRLQ